MVHIGRGAEESTLNCFRSGVLYIRLKGTFGSNTQHTLGFVVCMTSFFNTVRTGDADLPFYITTVQDG